ncbi:hypothetical protein KRP22_007828 [Phytophthora ramorum]|nr:hypothetical protein KRP22_4160 [Phytophthora ramorum]
MATAMTPAQQGASCARDGHAHDHKDDSYDLEDLAFDPTLASCCERDEHEYKKAMQLKAVLTAHDRTSGAVRMRQQLFQPPVTSSATLQPSVVAPQPPLESDSDFDDSDDEFGVEAMLSARRSSSSKRHRMRSTVLVVDCCEESGFLRIMRGEMAAVARRFLGTKFYVVRASCERDDDELRQLRLSSVPSLAAFRRGERVDSIVLDPKALLTELETPRQQQESVDEEETGFDCGVESCRLRFGYEHEHVGTSQQTKDEIASWRQTSA